jgi:hypothetical protein
MNVGTVTSLKEAVRFVVGDVVPRETTAEIAKTRREDMLT